MRVSIIEQKFTSSCTSLTSFISLTLNFFEFNKNKETHVKICDLIHDLIARGCGGLSAAKKTSLARHVENKNVMSRKKYKLSLEVQLAARGRQVAPTFPSIGIRSLIIGLMQFINRLILLITERYYT